MRRTPVDGSSSMPMTSEAGMHRHVADVTHGVGLTHQDDVDAVLLGRPAGAGHDLTGSLVASHAVDGDRERRERLTRRSGNPRH